MRLKILILSSVIGVLGVISCIEAVPIEVVYTGDSCDCPKKINYLVNMPPPPETKEYEPSEYGYKLDMPMPAKAKVTYTFDFMVEEPKKPPPSEYKKWDLFAKIDRITAPKKDCYASKEVPNTCSCNQCAAKRYVSPENSETLYSRNSRHSNSIDRMPPSPTSSIMAIFMEPLKQTKMGPLKSRKRRDISRIFMKPRKNEKRTDRVVKKYNKHLKDLSNNKSYAGESQKPTRSRQKAAQTPAGKRPLQRFSNFLNLPNLRKRRDIKGEYDLIEKEREQMDLTLPEIIQYLPETLDPNFKRNECYCRKQPDLKESMTITTPSSENTNGMSAAKTIDTNLKALNFTDANNVNEDEEHEKVEQVKEEEPEQVEEEEKDADNSISSSHAKRNAAEYAGGCPLLQSYKPTPTPDLTNKPPTNLEGVPRPLSTVNNSYGHDPVPQQYVGGSHNPYASSIQDNDPLLGTSYAKPKFQPVSDAQLDRIIAEIVRKHSDFIEASSHPGGALVDPTEDQKEQTKALLKNLLGGHLKNGWFGEDLHQQPIHSNSPYYNAQAVQSPPYYQ